VVFSARVARQYTLRAWEKLIRDFEAAIADLHRHERALRDVDETRKVSAALATCRARLGSARQALTEARERLVRQRAERDERRR
jgi:hypothetical protein